MKNRWLLISFSGLSSLLFICGNVAFAEDLSARQIVDRSLKNNAFGFNNAEAQIELAIFSKRGSKRIRSIRIKSQEENELTKTLVRFLAPADVAGTGFLLLENREADDEQYLFLPALGKVKRISGRQRNQSFMGTDLTYADMESRDLEEATLTRLPDEALSGNSTYVIEAVPKKMKESQYSKTKSWIHKTSFVPLKVEFFDKRGRALKTLLVRRLERKDGRWISRDTLIKNVQKKTKTEMIVQDIRFDIQFKKTDFTQRALKEG